jgi:hypothetical protein
MRAHRIIISLILLSLLLAMSSVVALAWQDPANPEATQIDWWVVAGGGGRSAPGAVVLEDTIGQPLVGEVRTGALSLSSGYWVGQGGVLFLPVVRK